MKYSIDRLDRIKELLHKRVGVLVKKQESIRLQHQTNGTKFFTDPEYVEVTKAYNNCWRAIEKIDEKFNQAVEDFIAEEIEIA